MESDSRRVMSLTVEHIARVARKVEDSGLPPGVLPQTDADYRFWVDKILSQNPAPDDAIHVFAYGSLIWKPEIEHVAECAATAVGWHRAFCFRMPRFRGTPDQPGLMMALEQGGTCDGLLFKLPMGIAAQQLDVLFRREFTMRPINSMPQWITVQTLTGKSMALAFVMNHDSPLYAPDLSLDQVAEVLAHACGHWGTGAEYLLNTVSSLEAKGIHDSDLWTLQKLVAAKIDNLLTS